MLPYPPPFASIVRVIVGTLVTAAGFAAIAGPAPWCNVLPLPLVFVGAALALPVLMPLPTE